MSEKKVELKTGYTTGSSATAAAKSALLSIINQKKIENVDIILPRGSSIQIPVNSCEFGNEKAKCTVITLLIKLNLVDVKLGDIELPYDPYP